MRRKREKLLTFDLSCRYEMLPEKREKRDKRMYKSGIKNKKENKMELY